MAVHSYSRLQGLSILWYVNAFHPVDRVVMSVQIYSPLFSWAFNDITNGTNPGCGELLCIIIYLLAIYSNYRALRCAGTPGFTA
jgi:hypothetical protein